jgi:hypothetical protein
VLNPLEKYQAGVFQAFLTVPICFIGPELTVTHRLLMGTSVVLCYSVVLFGKFSGIIFLLNKGVGRAALAVTSV